METTRQPKFYVGLAAFAAVVLFLIFGAAPLQMKLGIYGLFLTEVGILVIAVVPVILFGYDRYEIFPIRRPMLRQVIGVAMLWYGSLQLGYLVIYITMYLFPDGMSEVAWALSDFFKNAPLPALIISAAIMPAICEEALCRGLIQYSFSGLRRKWVTVLIVGLLFGVLHLDLYRFLPTMLLGLAMAYIMAETRNLLLPMLFHFVNNAWTTVLSWATAPLTEGIRTQSLSDSSGFLIGGALLMCAVVPWLILYGARLIKPNAALPEKHKLPVRTKTAAILLSVACAAGGIALIIPQLGALVGSAQTITNVKYTQYVSESTQPDVHPITIEESGSYMLSYSIIDEMGEDADGRTRVLFEGADGTVYTDFKAKTIVGSMPLTLESGEYSLTFAFEYGYDDAHPASVELGFSITRFGFAYPITEQSGLAAA
jgi:membrane protease YdiL (CAAX protease family)